MEDRSCSRKFCKLGQVFKVSPVRPAYRFLTCRVKEYDLILKTLPIKIQL